MQLRCKLMKTFLWHCGCTLARDLVLQRRISSSSFGNFLVECRHHHLRFKQGSQPDFLLMKTHGLGLRDEEILATPTPTLRACNYNRILIIIGVVVTKVSISPKPQYIPLEEFMYPVYPYMTSRRTAVFCGPLRISLLKFPTKSAGLCRITRVRAGGSKKVRKARCWLAVSTS